MHILRFLFGIAAADDFINAKETRYIHRVAGYLDINDKDFDEIRQSFYDTNNPYYLLGVSEDSSFEFIQTAYRKKVLQFHPDKRKEGTAEEEANKKFREIQHAFKIIKKQKG